MNKAQKIFETLKNDYPQISANYDGIYEAFVLLRDCYNNKGKTLVCGNGGSAADSEHIVGELMKGFNLMRPLSDDEKKAFSSIDGGDYIASKLQRALPSISLVSQSGLISAFANDIDSSLVYAQQVYAYASNSTDVLIALSTSGNSANVVNAAKTAKAAGIKILSITGQKESELSKYSDICIRLPKQSPYEVQELTLPVYHALCAMLEAEFFDS